MSKSSVIGIQKADNCYFHPDLDTVIENDDSIILISEDDDTCDGILEHDYKISEENIVRGEAHKATSGSKTYS